MVSGINRGWSVLCGILLNGKLKIRFSIRKWGGVKNRDCPLGRGIKAKRPDYKIGASERKYIM